MTMVACLPWRWMTDEALGDESQEIIIENFNPYHGNYLTPMVREAYGAGVVCRWIPLNVPRNSMRLEGFLLHFITTLSFIFIIIRCQWRL